MYSYIKEGVKCSALNASNFVISVSIHSNYIFKWHTCYNNWQNRSHCSGIFSKKYYHSKEYGKHCNTSWSPLCVVLSAWKVCIMIFRTNYSSEETYIQLSLIQKQLNKHVLPCWKKAENDMNSTLPKVKGRSSTSLNFFPT